MAYGLTGLTAGTLVNITNESSTKDAGLFQMPMPASDSDDAIQLDIFGASRTITIDGTFVDGTVSKTVVQFIAELDGLVNGSQSSVQYDSDTSGTHYHCLVQSVTWKRKEGETNVIDYTINLTEGSA